MRESASTDLREPQGSNPLGPPGPELRNVGLVYSPPPASPAVGRRGFALRGAACGRQRTVSIPIATNIAISSYVRSDGKW